MPSFPMRQPMTPPNPDSKASRKRARLFERQNGICPFCDRPLERPERGTFDHLFPKSKGGKPIGKNILLVHAECNQLKGGFATVDEAEQYCVDVMMLWYRLKERGYVK